MAKKNLVSNFIFTVIKPFRFWIIAQFLVYILWAVDFCLRPYLLKVLLDRIPVIERQDAVLQLGGPVITYIALSLLMVFIYRFSDYVWIKLNSPLKRHIGNIVMEKMMSHSQTLFQNNFAGNLANKIKDSMSGIPDLLRLCINTFFAQFLALLIAIFTVWTVNYIFALALCIWIIFFISISMILSKHAGKLSYIAAEVRSRVVGSIVDVLGNMINVRLFTSGFFELEKLKTQLDKWVIADQTRDWYFLWMNTLLGCSFVIYQAICSVGLIYGFAQGTISPGDFVLIFTINISIITIMWKLSEEMGKFADFFGNISQGLRIALTPIEIQDKPGAKTLKITRGKIAFDCVEFNYQGIAALFKNESILIKPGEKVGLVGYSGSGKSTFVNLILRLYDITKGKILIDDQDIRNVTQDSLLKAIGMIPQDPSLFHRTLMDNIRYGRMNASDQEVIAAAKEAHAHEFITQQLKGYETLVGERGIKLSGGQRQRIAIARVILKNAPILILDEATSQLDSVTENIIQETLMKLMENKTTLVIAHRLSTLLHMDRILVFDKGKIIQDGTHQELLAQNGLYKILWNAQVGGLLPEKN